MRNKIIKQIIGVLLLSMIPAFLSYMSNSALFFDKLKEWGFLGENLNIPVIQDRCLIISIVFSAVALSMNLCATKIKYDFALEQRNMLIRMNKKILSSSLDKHCFSQVSSFDIRIFIPKYPTIYKLAEKFGFKQFHKKFIIKNIDLISEQGITKNLEFEVYPQEEGLVGMCYKNKVMVYDDDLEHTNDQIYQLSKSQINRTSDLKWSICCPICVEADTVVAIVALDGKTKIKIDKKREIVLQKELSAFCYMLYDSVPQLFKRKKL